MGASRAMSGISGATSGGTQVLTAAWKATALIALSAALLSFFMLTRDNGWGDDFAGYIMQAQSIVNGNMSELVTKNILAVERSSGDLRPANYPWGFPLMLAPIYAAFGVKILGFKIVLVLCHALLVMAAFLLARTRLPQRDALILAAVIAYNAVLITEGQGEVLSDVPFAMISTAALWLIMRPEPTPSSAQAELRRGLLTGLTVFMSIFIRPNGLLLFLPLAASQIPSLRQPDTDGLRNAGLAILVPIVTVGALYGLQALVFPSSTLRRVTFNLTPQSLWEMARYYFSLAGYFFRHFGPLALPLFGLQIILVWFSVVRHWRRDLPLHLYLLATVILYIVFPYKQGIRYLFPVWPLFLLFTFDGLRAAAESLGAPQGRRFLISLHALWSAVALISFATCARLAWLNMANDRSWSGRTWGAFSPGSTAMFDFVRDHTPPGSVIIFYKPRAMSLRTGRDSFLTTDCAGLFSGDFVVTVESNGTYDQIAPERLQNCNPAVQLTPLYMKDLFIVYQIRHMQ